MNTNITMEQPLQDKESDLVMIICQNPTNKKRFVSHIFPFTGKLSRKEMIKLLPENQMLEYDARPLMTAQFLHKIDGIYYANKSTIPTEKLMEANSL